MGIDLSQISDIPPPGEDFKPEVGEKTAGKVLWAGSFRNLNYNEDGYETRMRVDLETASGDKVSIYATLNTNADDPDEGYPKRDARAIAAAVKKAGVTSIEAGGWLAYGRGPDEPARKKGHNPAKNYVAEYRPPRPVAPEAEVSLSDLMGDG